MFIAYRGIIYTYGGGFTDYHFVDLTDHMEPIIKHWLKLGIKFDCLYSWILGSPRQVELISNFIDNISNDNLLVVIDPVMGGMMVNYIKQWIKK